jgi:quercetin dioxygenase-like cupin family protein
VTRPCSPLPSLPGDDPTPTSALVPRRSPLSSPGVGRRDRWRPAGVDRVDERSRCSQAVHREAIRHDGTRIAVRRITITPGGETGYHYHDGPVFGVIRSGTLTHYGSNCAPDGEYRAGDLIYEPAGPGNIHIGRNEDRAPLVLDATYVLPAGMPFSTDAPAPPCES